MNTARLKAARIVNNNIRHFRGIRDSESTGIAIIFQELSLIKELTVGENIFLGREPSRLGVIDWSSLYHKASKLLQDLHLPIDPRVKIGSLGIGRQQLVEIAKALSQEAKILVLDEPTAALTESEIGTLFGSLEKLKFHGVGMNIEHPLIHGSRHFRARAAESHEIDGLGAAPEPG